MSTRLDEFKLRLYAVEATQLSTFDCDRSNLTGGQDTDSKIYRRCEFDMKSKLTVVHGLAALTQLMAHLISRDSHCTVPEYNCWIRAGLNGTLRIRRFSYHIGWMTCYYTLPQVSEIRPLLTRIKSEGTYHATLSGFRRHPYDFDGAGCLDRV
jgi:hypothetical protein